MSCSSPAIGWATSSTSAPSWSCPNRWSSPRVRRRGGGLRAASEESAADALQFSDVVPAYRDQVSKYGSDRMGLPYGGSALVLVYNRSAFEGEANREAARKAGVTLELPEDLEPARRPGEVLPGARLERRRLRPIMGSPWRSGATRKGWAMRPSWRGRRAWDSTATSIRSSSTPTRWSPGSMSPPFVEALRDLVALKESGPPGGAAFDAEAARGAFGKGNVAMLIDRAERASRWKGKSIGVAPLPGSETRVRPVSQALGRRLAAECAERLALWRRLARRGRHRGARPSARGGDRPREVPDRPRGLEPHPRRPRLPHAPGPRVEAGRRAPRPAIGPGRRPQALVRRGEPDPERPPGRRRPAHPRGRGLPRRPGRGPGRRGRRRARRSGPEIGRPRLVGADPTARDRAPALALPAEPQRPGHAPRSLPER